MTHNLTKNMIIIKQKLFSFVLLLNLINNIPKLFKYSFLSYEHSISIWDFLKRLSVIPKAIFICKILKKNEINHIHMYNTTSAATMGVIISKELKIPYSYTLHTVSQLNNYHKKTYFSISKDAKFIRSISLSAKRALEKYLPFSVPIIVNHLGIKVHEPHAKKLFLNNNIIMIAALEEYKRIDIAINAMRYLKDFDENIVLDIYGEGSLKSKYIKLIRELNIEKNVCLKGVVERKSLIDMLKDENKYSIILITSQPSKNGQVEGIPVALMEGMDSGLIPITSNSGATTELVLDEVNGFIAKSNNPFELSQLIYKTLNLSIEKKLIISSNARETINNNFNSKNTAKYLYSEIIISNKIEKTNIYI